ncbi:MAG: hypothetical protein K2J08_01640 [Ruminococcus sp.]|nr:hypothetical protein [Ruminococcus sp.]
MTEKIIEIRTMITDNIRYLDYSDYERRLQMIEMRGRLLELRYNHNHDEKGRFCSGGGGGRMSSFSDKRLYSNGGANPNKSIDNSNKNDIIKSEIANLGIKGKINIPANNINIDNLSFDNQHINSERNHNIDLKKAKNYIKEAKVSITRWNGQFENYYSEHGATYVDLLNNKIRTSFSSNEYDTKTKEMMKVIKKYGK